MNNPITPGGVVYDLESVDSPAVSPDGHAIAYVHRRTDHEADRSTSRLIMRYDSGETRVLTHGSGDTLPAWSPDGRSLAFLREDDSGFPQVWLMPTDGGEARQLSHRPMGVSEIAWAPDSRSLLLAADVPPDSSSDGEPRRTREVTRIRYRYDSVGWRGEMYRKLFVLDAETGAERQLTTGPYDDVSPAPSPNGRRVAFISGRRPDVDITARTEAYVMPIDGGPATRWSGGLEAVGAIGWSPDGSRLCAVATDLPGGHVGPLVYQGRVYALEEGGEPIALSDTSFAPATVAAPQHRGITMCWSAAGDVYLLASRAGRTHLCSVRETGGDMRVLSDEPAVCSALSASRDGSVFAVLGSGQSDPGNIWTWQSAEGRLSRVTGYNDDYMAEHPPARLQKGVYARAGMDIEYRVLFPPDSGPGAGPYPLVLDIHGGPNGAFYDSFVPWQQILATHGYVVLAVNPRGSSTYGADFMMSVLGDWGGEDYLDLMHVVDQVSAWPEIDEHRMGVHGYSYGGYMTCWAIGHTNRFRAAVAGAPCTDLISMYGTSDIGVSFGEKHWGGARRENIDRALDRSPITHAGAIETPLLLMHGETDVRVPIGQSEEMYVSLKRARKTVEFVRFQDCSHLFLRAGRPSLREEYHRRLLDWFDRHLAA